MSTWLDTISSSHRVQLFAVAILSAVTVSGAIFTFQAATRERHTFELKSSIPRISDTHHADELTEYGTASETTLTNHESLKLLQTSNEDKRASAVAARARLGDYDEDLILEQLARNRIFLTDKGLEKLRSSFVIVVGCGGVGSHAAAALARSGVSKLRLIDFDQVTLSSLNRHAVATVADVGIPKVQCIRKRIEQVTPWTHFDCRNELFSSSSAEKQLEPWDGQNPNYVLDAIDNIDSKVELLQYCHSNSIPVISSMGAGCKSDPTRIFIGDISASTEDPLSRATRRRLRALGIAEGIPVVYSTEKTANGKAQLQPLPDEEYAKGNVGDLGVLPAFRVRILPVLGTMPAMFGLTLANHVMLEISSYPHDYLISKARHKMYDAILASLQGLEERLARWSGEGGVGLRIPLTQDDVGYLVEEVFRGRSVISGLTTRLALIRWNWDGRSGPSVVNTRYTGQKSSDLILRNLVLMTKEEASIHEEEILKNGRPLESLYGKDVLELVERRRREELEYEKNR